MAARDENGVIGRNLMHSGPHKAPFLTFSPPPTHNLSVSIITSKFLSHLLILFAISYFSFYQFSSDSVLVLWSLPWGKSFETILSSSLRLWLLIWSTL